MCSHCSGHEFKKAKADGSEPGGSGAATLCDNVQGGCGGSWVPVPASTRRGQATSCMPANKDLWPLLAPGPLRQPLGYGPDSSPPLGASEPNRPCSGLGSAFLASPRPGRGHAPRAGGAAGPLGESRVELRGWRDAGPPAKGTASVSRSDAPTRVAAGLGSACGLRAAACCRQEASKCLRIWTAGERELVRVQSSWGPWRAHGPPRGLPQASPGQGPLGQSGLRAGPLRAVSTLPSHPRRAPGLELLTRRAHQVPPDACDLPSAAS